MPEESAAERTEEPTPERIRRAREKGQIPVSAEVPSAVMIVALLLALAMLAGSMYRWFTYQIGQGFSFDVSRTADASMLQSFLHAKAGEALMIILPILLLGAAVSVFTSMLVGGWVVAPSAVGIKFDRISPISGLKSLVSLKSLVRLATATLKLTVILAIVCFYLRDKADVCLSLRHTTPHATLVGASRLVFGAVARIAAALVAIAAADWLYQRWQYKRNLRMTRQEIKEERRQHELAPEVRGKMRAVHIEMARKRMLQEVPTADVVVTNPTHVAVALRYEAESMDSPQVVAKGADLLAEKIKDIARTHTVPIVRRPELARTLYANVEVGRAIPEALFVAVAEVLAMIYRLRRDRRIALGAPE